jgi:hypothetical protein
MTAMYVYNRSLHNTLRNIMPEEAFTGVKLEVGHLRIFGCPIYIHVPKEKRIKIDPSGRKGTFVGYNESLKAYQIYILVQRHIEVSRDVNFEEEVSFKIYRGYHMEIHPIYPINLVDPVARVDVPKDTVVVQKRPTWAHQTLQEEEGYAVHHGTF